MSEKENFWNQLIHQRILLKFVEEQRILRYADVSDTSLKKHNFFNILKVKFYLNIDYLNIDPEGTSKERIN